MVRHRNNPTYNVSNKTLIHIQDLAYQIEQTLRTADKDDQMLQQISIDEAIRMLDSIIIDAKMLKEEISKGPIDE